jgi:N-methylhydantoinase A
MLDIRSVGAGGGSIAWLDRAGLLQIGPMSAGADPGPACYGRGGRLPAVTDANVVLGRINAERPIGRGTGQRLRTDLAEQAIVEHIGRPLGLGAVEAAWGILQVANNKIAASIRTLTVEQGYDPRDFALIAYGGGGPLHACALLQELEIGRAVIPPWPGLTSALGCVTANVQHDFVQNANRRLDELDPVEFYRMLQRYVEQGRKLIESERIEVLRIEPRFFADMAYDGQIHEVRTPLPDGPCGRDELQLAFESAYKAQYGDTVTGGNGARRAVRLVTARVSVVGIRPEIDLAAPVPAAGATAADARIAERRVYFEGGFRDTAVFDRARLPREAELAGPAIVEQDDTTTVLMPRHVARVDAAGNLILSADRSGTP